MTEPRAGTPLTVTLSPTLATPSIDAQLPEIAPNEGLRIDRLNAYYGSFRALNDVTLHIRPRSVTAFIGPSGCGKTVSYTHLTLPTNREV